MKYDIDYDTATGIQIAVMKDDYKLLLENDDEEDRELVAAYRMVLKYVLADHEYKAFIKECHGENS
jgi:hypothetical protein